MEDNDEFIDQYKEVRRRGNVGDIRKWAVTPGLFNSEP